MERATRLGHPIWRGRSEGVPQQIRTGGFSRPGLCIPIGFAKGPIEDEHGADMYCIGDACRSSIP